jgi:hypothetical protein
VQRWALSFLWEKTRFMAIADAFHDEIQNAVYSYSGSWQSWRDREEDAIFVRPATQKAARI